MSDILVIPNAIPDSSARTLANLVASLSIPAFDVYSNVFESKLQVPKHLHSYPVVKHVLDILNSHLVTTLLGSYFGIPYLIPDQDAYFTALFMYRKGDRLQRHYDCAIHNDWRKAITVLLYLSDCEGGSLVVAGLPILPAFNTLVAFTNTDDAWHEVRPIQQGNRIVLTTGLSVPIHEELDNMTRTNQRALFIPGDNEVWDKDTYKLASERAT